jgi:hypothetical protein
MAEHTCVARIRLAASEVICVLERAMAPAISRIEPYEAEK